VGVASYASAVVAQKVALRRVSALQTTFLCCLVGTIASLPFAPSLIDETAAAPGASLAWVVYLGVFPTALAFTTWAYALARTSAGRLGATIYLVPPISVLLSWIVLSEAPAGACLRRRRSLPPRRRAEPARRRRRCASC
jgi:drug/metabolite transporter (DMT)-like permease